MVNSEQEELEELRREMHLNSLGDRPHSMAAAKLQRLIDLEARAAKLYCPVCGSQHELIASKCRAMDTIA